MPKVIALNLSAPLQSWAGYSVVKTRVDTGREPSPRAIKGLISAAFGIHRGSEIPDAIVNTNIEVVTVKSGKIVRDYQTVSGQDADREGSKPHNSEFFEKIGRVLNRGKSKPLNFIFEQTVIKRTYLADAQFLVFVQGATDEDTDEIYQNLLSPVWSPYLGRKAFAPEFPFILGLYEKDAVYKESEKLLQLVVEEVKA